MIAVGQDVNMGSFLPLASQLFAVLPDAGCLSSAARDQEIRL
jgi:hypothetical protein